MRIATMGAGGVNGYFGARLQQAGHGVVFIARGRHLAALRTDGLRIRSPLGDAHLKVKAVESAAEAGEVDVVLFAVKLWDTEAAARQLASMKAFVIPFQNGVESIHRLGAILGPERVLGGSAYIASRIESPGVIEHVGTMAGLQFGTLMPSQQAIAEQLLAACKQAGIDARLSQDIVRTNWEKFVFLVGLSSATAVSRAPLGVVRSDPDLRWLFEQAMRETWQVGRARGVALADDFVETRMQFAETLPAEMRASMLHDLQAGGRLEAPWLCGAVARMAREAGLEAPVNRSVLAALKPFIDGSARQAS